MSIKDRRPDHDDDGNELTPPSPDSDIGQLIYLLEYGRQRGFRIGPRVQIGDVVLEVADLRQADERGTGSDTDIWTEHGHKE